MRPARRPGRSGGAAALAACALLAWMSVPLQAQIGNGGASTSAFTVSARGGFDMDLDGPVLGAEARLAVPRLPLALKAAGDFTFLDRITERQLSLDVLYTMGGLALGGGPVFRNTIYDAEADVLGPRTTRTGYSLVLAVGGVPGQWGRLVTGLELRWSRVEDFQPQTITAQVGLALFRW